MSETLAEKRIKSIKVHLA